MAKQFKCATCEERKRPAPRRLANLEVNTEKCKIIQLDSAWWSPPAPDTRNKCQFVVLIDEASRFAMARLFRKDGGGHLTAAEILKSYHELWEPCFGVPELLRTDPDGACRSKELDQSFQEMGIVMENIPADAHWKLSVVERSIQWIKELMTKCAMEQPHLPLEAVLAQAVRTWNQREPVRGYSPYQWMLGKAPDYEDRLFTPDIDKLPGSLLHHPEGSIHRSDALRKMSEKAFIDWQYSEKLSRARNSRVKDYNFYMPGDLVFFWRLQGQGRQTNNAGIKKGAYAGPARILAMETKQKDGHVLPGSTVWLIRGMRLVKATVEQLRPATEREILIHELREQPRSGPWTITRLADELGGHNFDDVSKDGMPTDGQADPENVEPESDAEMIPDPGPGRRVTGKRHPLERDAEREEPRTRGVPPHLRESRSTGSSRQPLPQRSMWLELVQDELWTDHASSKWQEQGFAVEVSLELPRKGKQVDRYCKDAEQYFIKAMKRKDVEVYEKRMSPEERERFRGAKGVEVKKFLAAKAFEALPPHLRPDRSQALRMRWVLTYKTSVDGASEPKARAVILGFQDPDYANRPTFAPTMTRNSRQLLLQYSAWKGMTCYKGDVSGAFLQGREYARDLQIEPVPEICEGLGLAPGTLCKLKKACYGLVEAPIEWYETVNEFLTSIGYRQLRSDPCTWIYSKEGVVYSAISGHVDDFLFIGKDGCSVWLDLKARIQARFKWQDWEHNEFVQCGVKVSRKDDGSFELCQRHYVESIPEIVLSRDRRRDKHSATTDGEKSQLRALLGALSWHVGQVGYKYCAHVSLGLSEIPHSTVEDVEKANKLLQTIRLESRTPLKIHAFDSNEELVLAAWCDASSQNRHDGGSTEGILIGVSNKDLIEGKVARISPVFWKSGRIDRVCRSPGSAEARAAVNAEDNLYLLRYAWSEFCGKQTSAWEPDVLVEQTVGVLVTDSRNVYDRVDKPYISPKGANKKVDIELMAIKESQKHTKLLVRWVHSDAQLSNTLTKRGEEHQVTRFVSLGQQWRITYDPDMFSGKRRKEKGIEPLQ